MDEIIEIFLKYLIKNLSNLKDSDEIILNLNQYLSLFECMLKAEVLEPMLIDLSTLKAILDSSKIPQELTDQSCSQDFQNDKLSNSMSIIYLNFKSKVESNLSSFKTQNPKGNLL